MVATPPPSASPRLADVLAAEIGKLKEFVALLEREQGLLKQGDTDSLLPLADHKNSLAGTLAGLSQAREAELVRLGLPGGRGGMEAWIAQSGRPADQLIWSDWLQLATTARELNSLNGRLIGLHMQHNQQALATLMSATNRAMTYGPDGQQQTGLGGRILGTA